MKSAVVARLAMKRRATKFLSKNGLILLRDATDNRYPYLDEGAPEDRVKRGRWIVRSVDGFEHDAVRMVAARYLAVLEDDGRWDYAEQMDDAKLGSFQDPWFDRSTNERRSAARDEAMPLWESLPEHKKAWYEVLARVPYDDIVAIDEVGDEIFKNPHVYTDKWDMIQGPFDGSKARLQTIAAFDVRRINPELHTDKRFEFFARKK